MVHLLGSYHLERVFIYKAEKTWKHRSFTLPFKRLIALLGFRKTKAEEKVLQVFEHS